MAIALLAPEPLRAEHVLDGFICGESMLDEFRHFCFVFTSRHARLSAPTEF